MVAVGVLCQPATYCHCKSGTIGRVEIGSMSSGHLAKYRQVARQNRDAVVGGFD